MIGSRDVDGHRRCRTVAGPETREVLRSSETVFQPATKGTCMSGDPTDEELEELDRPELERYA